MHLLIKHVASEEEEDEESFFGVKTNKNSNTPFNIHTDTHTQSFIEDNLL